VSQHLYSMLMCHHVGVHTHTLVDVNTRLGEAHAIFACVHTYCKGLKSFFFSNIIKHQISLLCEGWQWCVNWHCCVEQRQHARKWWKVDDN